MKNTIKTLILTGLILGALFAISSPALAAQPIISGVNVSNISQTSATLNATIDPQGESTSAWFEYPVPAMVSQTNGIVASQPISYNVTGLTCGTTYNFNVGAINMSGQVISNNSFQTSPCAQAPTVVTATASNITQTSADLGGSVNPNGSSTTAWFEYNGQPISGCPSQNIGSGNAAVQVTPCTKSGLQPGQSYAATLNAASLGGTDLKTINFSTQSVAAPTISNVNISNIAQTSVTLNATINPNGSNTSAQFEVSPSWNPVGQTNNINSTQTISYNLTSLTCGGTYNVQVNAINLGGSVLSSQYPFTTSGCGNSPTMTTVAASGISSSGATLNGTYNANGLATTTWFEYDTDGNVPFANSTSQILQGTGSGAISATIGSLSASTTYYFRACGTNAQGTNCGSVLNFQTSPIQSGCSGCGGGQVFPPTATTVAASSFSTSGATLNGSYNANGYSTTTWFQYGTSSSSLNLSTSPVTQGTGSGSMSATVTGLANNTYYFRAAAQNTYGTVYGGTLSFTIGNSQITAACADGIDNDGDSKIDLNDPGCASITDTDEYNAPINTSNLPQALTTIATDKTSSTAKLNALVVINGGPVSTEAWFEYGKTVSLGQATSHSVVGSAGQIPFSQTISSLSAGTIYFYRAGAKNSYGTNYGPVMFFQTAVTQNTTDNNTNNNNTSDNNTTNNTLNNTNTNSNTNISSTTEDNVTVTISADKADVKSGDIINYTVAVKNNGNKTITNTSVKVLLPKDVDFKKSDVGSYNVSDNTVSVNIGALEPAKESNISIEAKVNKNVKDGDILLATVNLAFTGSDNEQKESLAYATNKVIELPLAAAAGLAGGAGSALGWFLIVIGVALLAFLGQQLYAEGKLNALLKLFKR